MDEHDSDVFILCADHRIHIWSAVKRQGLLLPGRKFDKLSGYGVQIYLAYPRELERDYNWIAHQLRFGTKTFPPVVNRKKRVVLIGHRKCGYYSNIPKRPSEDEEKDDVLRSAETVSRLSHGTMDVEAYYAIRDGGEVFLETLLGSAINV
ncbi:MAG: hypothetical protein A2358_01230 [Candidatus Staskawiczbacteria bacterium RIFOXYB1_FULL_37_44]|uniref:Uncharacterized protein n=1 Tax=Candidatus Staskawiczbacteria bacterium RIFOXYB1_FULL_37_44 TaxID=1802223 RepID=A0A1G2IZM4_9BACT|nr:MAG: hypothetical protein A2358_01230 [Candidatus Staskawiczbacteria bacterium RIFOXYB1_FULL_37_44]OGZ83328.1 MAG: hypothetical protein A2416_01965 [Candidatus Staskawiczbacteria bacterium RIFOXYC1_FULL_37_52]